ncbi:MAG: hypothetical protein KatS3mg078_0022 [Deltaproteobacteria bacterium]|jgi:TM2 domain-containing membrane protein YozV|nr:hypothetical protein HRbin37_01402 [bacterium HR37]GIW46145.1 MAG: hypothetical protein KatS3mg078_0022 [Deltaproteobacteria bacterium]
MDAKQGSKKKNPLLALILSVIFPGLGQIYNGQVLKGVVIAVVNVSINLLLIGPLERLIQSLNGASVDRATLIIVAGYTLAGTVILVYAALDAKRTADRINMEAT